MKHIGEIIAFRKMQLERGRQLSLFATTSEKGSREWKMFDPVAHDRTSGYQVTTPRKSETPRYPNVLHINRYPRQITPTFAR